MTYQDFLDRKAQLANAGGFVPTNLPAHLFDFQRATVEWAVRQGRGAIFAALNKLPVDTPRADATAISSRAVGLPVPRSRSWIDFASTPAASASASCEIPRRSRMRRTFAAMLRIPPPIGSGPMIARDGRRSRARRNT